MHATKTPILALQIAREIGLEIMEFKSNKAEVRVTVEGLRDCGGGGVVDEGPMLFGDGEGV